MKYTIIVESDMGKFFEETFEEVSGVTLRERMNEILTDGYSHKDFTGDYKVAPRLIKSIRITKKA